MPGVNGEESMSKVVKLSPLAATMCDLPGIRQRMVENRNYVTQKILESKISLLHRDFLENGDKPPEPPDQGIDASFEERANFTALSILYDLEQVKMGEVADSLRDLGRCYEVLCVDFMVGEKKFPEIIGSVNTVFISRVERLRSEGSFDLSQASDQFKEAVESVIVEKDYGDGTERVRNELAAYGSAAFEVGKHGDWCTKMLQLKGYLG